MGFRFGRSIRLLPGVRLNLGLRGASVSVGPPGASVNIGRRGVHGTVGLPGTGLSYRTRLDAPHAETRTSEPDPALSIEGDDVVARHADGRDAGPEGLRIAMRGRVAEVRTALRAEADARNQAEEHALRPVVRPAPECRRKPVQEDGETRSEWVSRVSTWRAACANDAEDRLVRALEAVSWGRETNIACSVDGSRVLLEVDLPEIEDLPHDAWAARPAGSEPGLSRRPMTSGERHRRYARHVAAVVRTCAEAVLGAMDDIAAVALNARTTRATGEDCVAAGEIGRDRWAAQAGEADDELAIARMGVALATTSTGRLLPQTPTTT